MEQYSAILKKCILFQGIRDAELPVMLRCLQARLVSFDKKYTILAEGYPAKYLGILLSGGAQIQRMEYSGDRTILDTILPGEVFAESFACAEVESSPVSIVAAEPSTALLIDAGRILHPCEKHCAFHQQLIFNLTKVLAEKNLQFHQKLEITAQRTTREKLMTYLYMQARQRNTNEFDIPFDRQALADYLQVDRSGLSAEISKLRREGVLENQRNHFVLL